MNLYIPVGLYLLPIVVFTLSLVWVFFPRASERPTGGMFGDMGAALGVMLRAPIALSATLAATLIWALFK